MNNMWGMVRKNYVMHLIMAILCMLVSFVGSEWVGFAMGLAIYVVYVMMQYGDGVDRGERACTLSATVDKIQSEGKTVEDRMLRQRFDPKGAVKAFVISSVPLALIAIANLVLSDPDSVTESTFGIITRVINLPVVWLTRLLMGMVGIDYTGTHQAGNAVFASLSHAGVDFTSFINSVKDIGVYAYSFDLHYLTVMRICFIPVSFIPSLAMMIGYMQGPKYREKKLKEIEKGTRKKRKKLKVYGKQKQRKQMKPEI